jgi:hypothetical protein
VPPPRQQGNRARGRVPPGAPGALQQEWVWALKYSVGFDLTEAVRGAITEIADDTWVRAVDQDGSDRPNGQVCQITDLLDLTGWPAGSRVLVRRDRAHPGAQLSFTDVDGHRLQAILTDQTDSDIAALQRDQGCR